MDGIRFDALTKSLAGGQTRRRVLTMLAGVVAVALASPASAATGKPRGAICRKHGECASGNCGPKDATGRQRCQPGTGDPCAAPSECPGGQCLEGICCAGSDICLDQFCCDPDRAPTETCCPGTNRCCECFERTDPGNERIECCPPEMLCKSLTNSPADDECCHADEVCINGDCCWIGTACEGQCCPTQCCNGACCGDAEDCVVAQGDSVVSCQPQRACTVDSDCNTAAQEICATEDGVCCPLEQQTSVDTVIDGEPVTLYFCCPLGQAEDIKGGPHCCDLPDRCGTSRGSFSRL